ncbi:cleavage polyadenylation factor subunit fip1 [Tilletia horrida]|uniref:Cleavage polyadenylation factor subunit fip1 n=1 Tax=Tilletia horrida TaxID=155126 RepID=A0AAN6GVF0_9BASI|nr:cleavage polyadenylation factor subunit fip1 [Tilletia horrida]KAK0557103.1 cleavage polyadenylation factor subunit fip1 [Tilletia horrida]
MEDEDAFLYGSDGAEEATTATQPAVVPSAVKAEADPSTGHERAPAQNGDKNHSAKVNAAEDGDEEEEGEDDEDDDDEEEEEDSDDDLEIITEAPVGGSAEAAATAAAYNRTRQQQQQHSSHNRLLPGTIPRQVSTSNLGSGGLTSEYTPLSRTRPLPDSPANAIRQSTPGTTSNAEPGAAPAPPPVPVTSLGLLDAKLEPQYDAFKDLGPEVAPGPPPSTAPRLDLSPRRAALYIDPETGLSTAPDGVLQEEGEEEPEGPMLYEVDPASFSDKPWRRAGADLSDYFNYGFNEDTWRQYSERKRTLMKTREELLQEKEEQEKKEQERLQLAAEEQEKKRKADADAAALAAANSAKEAEAARGQGFGDDIPNHDQLLRQMMNMLAPGMPPPQQMTMLQQMGVVNPATGRLNPQMLQMMGMLPGAVTGGIGGPPPPGSGMGPNAGMMGMAPPPGMGMPGMSMPMAGFNMNPAVMGIGPGPGMMGNSFPPPPGGPRADRERRIPSGPAGAIGSGLPNRPPSSLPPPPTGPRAAVAGHSPVVENGSNAEFEEGERSTPKSPARLKNDPEDDTASLMSQDATPTGPKARGTRGGRGQPAGSSQIPTGPSGGNGRAPPTGPAADRHRNSGANNALPPNVPTGPRGSSSKAKRYNDRDVVSGAPDALDYGAVAGSSGGHRRDDREMSSPPPRSTSGRGDDEDRRSSRRRGGGNGGSDEHDRDREKDRDRSERDRDRERDRDERDRRESSGYRSRDRDRDRERRSDSADERRNSIDGARERSRAERRAGKTESSVGSKRGREEDEDVSTSSSTRRRR